MDLTTALIAAISAEAAALGVMWLALTEKVKRAEAECEKDRAKLWELVRRVAQLDRRHDITTDDAASH